LAKRIAEADTGEKRAELKLASENRQFVSFTRQLGKNKTLICETGI
jgi:hypothetical protein